MPYDDFTSSDCQNSISEFLTDMLSRQDLRTHPRMECPLSKASLGVTDMAFPGLPAGALGSLVGTGGAGKSWLALEIALAVASPAADLIGLGAAKSGPVVYYGAEDSREDVGNRLYYLAERLKPEVRIEAERNLQISPMPGEIFDLGYRGGPERPVSMDLVEMIHNSKGARLIILDPLIEFHQLEENSNNQMAGLLRNLKIMAKWTGAAVLFVHHANKAATRDGVGDSQAASRGASALVNSVRWSANLARMTEAEAAAKGLSESERGLYLCLSVTKQNHGETPPPRWLKRHAGGVLLPVTLIPKKENKHAGTRQI